MLGLLLGDRLCVRYPIPSRQFRAVQGFVRFLKQESPIVLLFWEHGCHAHANGYLP